MTELTPYTNRQQNQQQQNLNIVQVRSSVCLPLAGQVVKTI